MNSREDIQINIFIYIFIRGIAGSYKIDSNEPEHTWIAVNRQPQKHMCAPAFAPNTHTIETPQQSPQWGAPSLPWGSTTAQVRHQKSMHSLDIVDTILTHHKRTSAKSETKTNGRRKCTRSTSTVDGKLRSIQTKPWQLWYYRRNRRATSNWAKLRH